ncbi:oxidoreductase [Flavobacterium sp. Root935]|uniref:SDR family NAD(P)-dependent oxidoreductase n=1 Tax=Flavobacterium sp. Root935 TaxID=1736610 RepID=UPI00070F6DCE|nr:SDR family NAD(P)-dependent oxidoreductase [Flavobacterium sp. Root935]KRD58796.1 oxidoreductase [Flavobacterium sp. Root935]
MEQNNYDGALQNATGSGFKATSTTLDVIKGIDLTGKNVIITGGNTGIGLETVITLANAGATVIVPTRNRAKAAKNLQGIDNVEIEEMDLMNHSSIDRFAEKFLASGRVLHLLINNAGIMFVPLRRDARGIESQLATNYLATFQLTAKLWPALKKANGARVINISSQGHQFGSFNFDDPNYENREYETLSAYGQSKTAVNLFSLEFDNLAKAFGVRAYSLHPGNIWGTELLREAPMEILQQFGFYDDKGEPVQAVVESLKTIPQGAATTVWAATSQSLNTIGGVYLEDADIAALALGQEMSAGVKPYSLDESNAKNLWKWTEEITGIEFEVK